MSVMFIVAMAEITSTLSNLFGGSSDEKKEDTNESEDQDTQTVAGDDGDASKEKESEKEEKKPATDETVKQDSETKEAKTEKQKQDKEETAKEKKQEKTDEGATKEDNGDKSAKSEKDKEKKSDEESTQETPSPSVENATNQTTGITSPNFYLAVNINLHFFLQRDLLRMLLVDQEANRRSMMVMKELK